MNIRSIKSFVEVLVALRTFVGFFTNFPRTSKKFFLADTKIRKYLYSFTASTMGTSLSSTVVGFIENRCCNFFRRAQAQPFFPGQVNERPQEFFILSQISVTNTVSSAYARRFISTEFSLKPNSLGKDLRVRSSVRLNKKDDKVSTF